MPKCKLNNYFLPVQIIEPICSRQDYYKQPIDAHCLPLETDIFPLKTHNFTLDSHHLPLEEQNLPFFRLHIAIWQLRPADLQKLYPLDSIQGRIGFMVWCVVHGRSEYIALRELKVFWDALAQPATIPETAYSSAITRFMQLIVISRPDLKIDSKLETESSQLELLRWFCLYGWKEMNLTPDDIAESQKKLFETNLPNGFRFIDLFIYAFRSDLQSQFPLSTPQGQLGFRQWILQNGNHETILALLQPKCEKVQSIEVVAEKNFGVNLIGYAFGELGIGEDVRMAALALKAANIPFTVINFRPGDDIRQNDLSIEQWVSNQPIYSINIVCLTALEHLRIYAEQGEALFKNRYTIGYWPWELQNWPANWEHCFHLVDEVWSSSQHTWQAVKKKSPVPTLIMPMAVALPKVKRFKRKQWSLPESDYLFVFSFDGNSSLARKNPLGIIKAFNLAFPNRDEAVGLVIKCMRPDVKNPAWQTILEYAKVDPRIHIMNKMLDKPDVLGLYKLCNCFVSLHRAEGFGRGIAEALLLGLKVIATDQGGNVDFCLPGSAYLVPSKPCKVGKKEYIESTGQFWAEPDIPSAARYMQDLASKGIKSKKTVKDAIKNQFSLIMIGEKYKNRLNSIFSNISHLDMNT